MVWRTALAGLALSLATVARSEPLPKDELERNCWQRYTAERTRVNVREPTWVDFSNLRHGYQVRSPFMVEFAVRGMGVVPAGKALAGAGHHHLLIDARLPVNIGEKIPFSDTHRHFGKGQTFGVIDVKPGSHTLRLLFADHDHKPYFVYSPEITVLVSGPRTPATLRIDPQRFEETCSAWYQEEQSRPRAPGEAARFANLRDGESVTSPFVLRLSVDGFGVSAAGVAAERTGHFVVEALRDGKPVQKADLSNGATQVTMSLPNGSYRLRLHFIDAATRKDLTPVSEQLLVVTAQDRL